MTKEELMIKAVKEFGDFQYQQGLEKGLMVAERIRNWLTRQPDTKRQKEVREWADTLIDSTKRNFYKEI